MNDSSADRLRQAIAQHQQGDLAGAEVEYRQILAQAPDNAEARNALGILHLQRGDSTAASEQFRIAAELAPETAKYHSNLGSACLARGDGAGAIAAFEAATACEPGNAEFLANLATARMSQGDGDGAERDFRRALELAPTHAMALNNLGGMLSRQNRLPEAAELLQRAAALLPDGDETHLNLASVLERLNRLPEAEAALSAVRRTQAPAAIMLRARLLRRQGEAAAALRLLDQVPLSEVAARGQELLGDWQQEIGLAADLCQDPGRAFEAFLAAKTAWRQAAGKPDDAGEAYLAHVRRLRRTDVEPTPASATAASPLRLAFLAGFPRSGTTLLEVMLGAHPQVRTTEERDLLAPLLGADGKPLQCGLAAAYRAAADAQMGKLPADTLLLDKLPLNLVHCRTIDASLPGARLLVALRDPRDVVLSCLMQRFRYTPAMANFDALGSAVSLYEEVMSLWLEVRNELRLPVFEYRYEDLVSDWRGTVSAILDFLDLRWDDKMETYREQTREITVITPSYRDVAEPLTERARGRWHRYRTELAPVLPRLAPFAEAFGYDPD